MIHQETANRPVAELPATDAGAEGIDTAFLCTLVIAAIVPVLGLGSYFRNEDARYIVWLGGHTGILDAFHLGVRYHPVTFRPISEIALRIIYRLSGNNPLPFQIVGGAMFIGSVALLYRMVKLIFDSRAVAFLTILSLFSGFFFTLHFLYTPIQGFQFPMELVLMTGSLYLSLRGLRKGYFGYNYIIAILLAVLAAFTHPVSAFLVPLLNISLVLVFWRRFGGERLLKKLVVLAVFGSLWFMIPVVTRQGEARLVGVSSVFGYIPLMLNKYMYYGSIFLRGYNFLLVTTPVAFALFRHLIPRYLLRSHTAGGRKGWKGFLSALAFALAVSVLIKLLPQKAGFITLSCLIAVTAVLDRIRLFLTIWFFGGIAPILVSPAVTGTYVRHAAMALSVNMGLAYREMIDGVIGLLGGRVRRAVSVFSLNRLAVVLTLLALCLLFAARYDIARIPIVSKQMDQLDYFKDMGNNFKETISYLDGILDRNAHVYFYRVPSRLEENGYIYSDEHLERLQPAKFKYYPLYFEMLGRKDIVVEPLEEMQSVSGPRAGERRIVVATNNREVDYMESNYSLRVVKVFERRKAVAKIYEYTAP